MINGKGEVLLELRADTPLWVLPGGKIESGEGPKQAVVREVLEETGLKVKVLSFVGKYVSSYLSYLDATYLFLCAPVGGKLRSLALKSFLSRSCSCTVKG